MIDVICNCCNKPYSVNKSRISKTKFCSKNCLYLYRKNETPWNKGKKLPYQVWNKGKTGYSTSKKGKTGFKGYWTGKKRPPFSEEWKKNMKGFIKGYIPWNKGMIGEDSISWKGGLSLQGYGLDWTDTLRESIRMRDNYICVECGIHQEELKEKRYNRLDVHHIDYDKDNCDPNNLISLCRSCHVKTNSEREGWSIHFTNLINSKKNE